MTNDKKTVLAARWKQLVEEIDKQFLQHNQDSSAVFTHDLAARKLRANLQPNLPNGEKFVMTLAQSAVLQGNLRQIAADFVEKYRAADAAKAK